MVHIKESADGVTFKVRVQPRASNTELAGEYGDAVKIRIAAPPVDGKANDECRRFIARLIGVPAARVDIVSGDTHRDKLIRVSGVSTQRVRDALGR